MGDIPQCVRCGQCCISVGLTFWRNGDFENCSELRRRAALTKPVDEGLPCEMLEMCRGIAICRIERFFGYEFKPKVCKEYPADGEKCHYVKQGE